MTGWAAFWVGVFGLLIILLVMEYLYRFYMAHICSKVINKFFKEISKPTFDQDDREEYLSDAVNKMLKALMAKEGTDGNKFDE